MKRFTSERILDRLLSDTSTGTASPPNDWAHSKKYPSRGHGMSTGHEWFAARFSNDAFDLVIFTKYTDQHSDTTSYIMAAEDFRKIAMWYLWRWVWGEWFGLRRKLFYRRLHYRIGQRVPPLPYGDNDE